MLRQVPANEDADVDLCLGVPRLSALTAPFMPPQKGRLLMLHSLPPYVLLGVRPHPVDGHPR